MSSHRTLRHAVIAASLAVAFLFQGTWALAGTTGNIAGLIKNASGAPIAGVTVQAVSASQTATATTDAGGHFILLSLAPDTYTLNLSKEGYQSVSFPGNVVFADQTQQVAYTLQQALRTIAHVTAQSAASLVKSGVGGDLYSVNASQISASTGTTGGGNLNTAYSAIATVPGLYVGTFGAGWNQAVVVRGQNPWFTGYEYDGIPVNRSFDNYNSSTESNLGLQQLEVYTGGGPSSIASNGISGFINQVIKTGTFPGYANLTGGLAAGTFYNQAGVEAGGSTPDRSFSYYVGFNGYNQTYNYFDPSNGASLMEPGGPYPIYTGLRTPTASGQSDVSTCPVNGVLPSGVPGCWGYAAGLANQLQQLTDRESIVNLHWGIPHSNGLRDDVQFLWSTSAERSVFNYNPSTQVGADNNVLNNSGTPLASDNYVHYQDGIAYNLPFGSVISTGPGDVRPYGYYFQPSTPSNRAFFAQQPSDYFGDLYNNDTGIVKLQYTHQLSERSYLRVFGYTFFSDWTESGATSGYSWAYGPSPVSPNYDLVTHTSGGELQYSNQINDQNLVTVTGNYTTASVLRLNNEYFEGGLPVYGLIDGQPACNSTQVLSLGATACNGVVPQSPIGYMKIGGKNGFTCYDPTSGKAEPCTPGGSWETGSWLGPNGYGAAAKGATWDTLWNGNNNGPLNQVKPEFGNVVLADEFRPNDRILIDAAIRYDNFNYGLADSNNLGAQFAAFQVANYTCVNPGRGNTVLVSPLLPGQIPPANPIYGSGDCDALYAANYPGGKITKGWVHPNGTVQDGVSAPSFTNQSPGGYDQYYYSPRAAITYTESPDTVWRFSAGRYTEPPISASTQYLYSSEAGATSLWANFMGDGFYSPFHPIPGTTSAQYDLSYERHFRGTDWSMKVTPFYTATSNWEQQAFIGSGFVTQVPVGKFQSEGAELAVTKGDFNRNGLSGQLAFTYTHAAAQYQNLLVPNLATTMNQQITAFNTLTKAGGGSACYAPFVATNPVVSTMPCSNPKAIRNPYYNMSPQGLLNPSGWYPASIYQLPPAFGPSYGVYAASYTSPYTATALLSYRHDRFAVTPSLIFLSGTAYGSPMDVAGVDPRVCGANQTIAGVVHANGQYCDYLTQAGVGASGYLYIPNPQTGSFASLGQYIQPNILTGNMQITYDVTPKVRLTMTAANIFRTCFGGTAAAWTAAFPPSPNVCSYYPNGGSYISNYYNGKSPFDTKANPGGGGIPYLAQSYGPSTNNGPSFIPNPFAFFVQAQVKI